jgi:hypothetical protein
VTAFDWEVEIKKINIDKLFGELYFTKEMAWLHFQKQKVNISRGEIKIDTAKNS